MSLQSHADGRLRHLLGIGDLSPAQLQRILDTAESFCPPGGGAIRKFPLARGKTVVNLFFEPSTRTRTTFELAAKRLSADVLNLQVAASSATKGETLLDTLETLQAMQVDMFVVRHESSGAAHFNAEHAQDGVSVLNAGDGRHAHPTQALLDVFTIRRHKPDFTALRVAIVGDILHSRVARSEIRALKLLGVPDIRVVGPRTLLPRGIESLGVSAHDKMEAGIEGADVVIMLRLQRERMDGNFVASESEFFHEFGLTRDRLSRLSPETLVMHPGPINRGIEIESEVAYGSQSVILQQVTHGIAIRMAVMAMILGVAPAGGGA